MNDLEQELKRLAPRGLSDRTRQNIRREAGFFESAEPALQHINGAPTPFRGRRLLRAAAVLAVAAGLAALLFMMRSRPPVEPGTIAKIARHAPVTNEPTGSISMSTVLVERDDEGTIVDAKHGPVRCVRYRFVDNIRWDRPGGGGSVTRQTPREEVILVSVPVD